ncbi:MAG: hemerythrin family protein [Betaproteobacteria bacterium]|jgi:hemerythrin-like metal-binding protein|nr:hemerythrin family protein [Betaproteobacteria bacterium]
MALLNWKNDYQLGNALIDRDHRQLFELINSFHYEFIQNRNRVEILRLLNDLVRYCEEHFGREEAMMANQAYPGLEQHLQKHAELFETIFALQTKLEADAIRMEQETVAFLRHWLTDHIAEEDRAFARFLANPA